MLKGNAPLKIFLNGSGHVFIFVDLITDLIDKLMSTNVMLPLCKAQFIRLFSMCYIQYNESLLFGLFQFIHVWGLYV